MQAVLILGGNPTRNAQIRRKVIEAPRSLLLEALPKTFVNLKPLEFNPNTAIDKIPEISCCACQFYTLVNVQTLTETLVSCCISSSLQINAWEENERRKPLTYLLCRTCAEQIEKFLDVNTGDKIETTDKSAILNLVNEYVKIMQRLQKIL